MSTSSEQPPASSLEEGAARRLKEALAKIAENNIDECPVCLECPAPADARVLRCCQAIMCKDCIPGCKRTCPFCRLPFEERIALDEPDYESPYTYTTKDYSMHTEFISTIDYTVRRYSSSTTYTTKDYSASSSSSNCSSSNSSGGGGSSSTTTSYTTKDYSSSKTYTSTTTYTSTADYSVSSDKYSVSGSYTTKDYSATNDYSS